MVKSLSQRIHEQVTESEPEDVALAAWAEFAPQKCLIVTEGSLKWVGFSDVLEALNWAEEFFPQKSEVLAKLNGRAILIEAQKRFEKKNGGCLGS